MNNSIQKARDNWYEYVDQFIINNPEFSIALHQLPGLQIPCPPPGSSRIVGDGESYEDLIKLFCYIITYQGFKTSTCDQMYLIQSN